MTNFNKTNDISTEPKWCKISLSCYRKVFFKCLLYEITDPYDVRSVYHVIVTFFEKNVCLKNIYYVLRAEGAKFEILSI